MHRIVVAGHICVDIRPQLSETAQFDPGKLVEVGPVRLALGGSVWNTGRALTAMGAPVTVFCCVGDDKLGRLVRGGVGHRRPPAWRREAGRGSIHVLQLHLEPAGVDRTIWHHVGANAAFTGAEIDMAGWTSCTSATRPCSPDSSPRTASPCIGCSQRRGPRASPRRSISPCSTLPPQWPTSIGSRSLARMTSQTDVVSPSLDDLTSVLRITERPHRRSRSTSPTSSSSGAPPSWPCRPARAACLSRPPAAPGSNPPAAPWLRRPFPGPTA